MRLIFLLLCLSGCGPKSHKPDPSIVNDSRLSDLKSSIELWVKPCKFEGVEYPCERVGDSTNEDHVVIWSGLLCLSSKLFCDIPARSQSDDGRLWRSPSQVITKVRNSMSRDALLGHMASWAVTKNQDAAWKSYQYIRGHSDELCDDADDNRCDVEPFQYRAIWGTMKHVFKNMGLKPTPTMEDASSGDDQVLWTQAAASPIGYQLHLVAMQLHIRKKLGYWNGTLQNTAEILKGKDPRNAYFLWLANAEKTLASHLVLERCPREPGHERNDWIWSSSNESMGYDCIFMIDLLTSGGA